MEDRFSILHLRSSILDSGSLGQLEEAFPGLVRDSVLVPHEIEGLRGPWYVHRDLLDDGDRSAAGRPCCRRSTR